MKIVDRKTFLAMPAGAVFQKYEANGFDFGPLSIKGDSLLPNDFFYEEMRCSPGTEEHPLTGDWIDALQRACAHGEDVRIELGTYGRDACFDAAQLFAVWDEGDVRRLIVELEKAITLVRLAGAIGSEPRR